MAKRTGKKLQGGKSLKAQKSTTIVEYPPITVGRLSGNHSEMVLRG